MAAEDASQDTSPPGGKAVGGSLPNHLEVLGEVSWLYSLSNVHGTWEFASLHQWILPPLLHKQFRIYRNAGKPVGFVSWAFLTAEKETEYCLNPNALKPQDWNSGDRLWFIDWVFPRGGTKIAAKDLKTKIFPDQVGRFLRYKKGSDTTRVFYVHGVNAVEMAGDENIIPSVDLKR